MAQAFRSAPPRPAPGLWILGSFFFFFGGGGGCRGVGILGILGFWGIFFWGGGGLGI